MLKGYDLPSGYMGWVEKLNKYMLFSCYRDYVEYVTEEQEVCYD